LTQIPRKRFIELLPTTYYQLVFLARTVEEINQSLEDLEYDLVGLERLNGKEEIVRCSRKKCRCEARLWSLSKY